MDGDTALLDSTLFSHQHTPVDAAPVPSMIFLLAIRAFAGDGMTSLVLGYEAVLG